MLVGPDATGGTSFMTLLDTPDSRGRRWRPTRRRTLRFLAFLLVISIAAILVSAVSLHSPNSIQSFSAWVPDNFLWSQSQTQNCSEKVMSYEAWNRTVINGPPTREFRDALLPNERYVTAFMIAGWTNDVMAGLILIYYGILTNRIPIVPPFYPTHVGAKAGIVHFSEFFDLQGLASTLNIPIVEWQDVKNSTSASLDPSHYYNTAFYGGEDEEIGCWSVWMTQHARGTLARGGFIPEALTLDVSWTPVPFGHQVDPDAEEYNLHALADLNDPSYRGQAVKLAKESYLEEMQKTIEKAEAEGQDVDDDPPTMIPVPNRLENQVDPDEHLLCFDYLYFTGTHKRSEFWWDDGPVWNAIGTYLHFSQTVLSLSEGLLRKVFSVTDDAKLPLFVSVHIRRNDFTVWCFGVPRDDCLAPLSAYIRRVKEVKTELVARHPELAPEDIPVIVMTDEPHTTEEWTELPGGESEKWWKEVDAQGWKSVRHDLEKTEEKYGLWYPSVLDACMLSMGSAFIGTDKSTYSLIAQRRVQDWARGPTRLVRWGSVGADDH